MYPVIDLFAGPGGLGEGFASLLHPRRTPEYVFRTGLSIESDPSAHRTLRLRHFYRTFQPATIPHDYYRYLEGVITLEELYKLHPEESYTAEHTAWLCKLGDEPHENVRGRIARALKGHTKWALVGGPPCQAYSLAGRSRMSGNPDFEADPRHLLYKEYLRILIDHKPPVFVMENVKGLISSKIEDRYVIHDILRDLSKPVVAEDQKSGLEYKLYSLSQSGVMSLDADPSAFVVKAEEYGIPQARHRIFILGIRSDVNIEPRVLEKSDAPSTVQEVINDLPKLRSGLSQLPDSDQMWMQVLAGINHQPWFIHGRENGCEVVTQAESVLNSLTRSRPRKTSTCYTPSPALSNWLRDDRLNVLLSHEARSHMSTDLHRYFFAALYTQVNDRAPRLRDFPQELLPDHKNVREDSTESAFQDRFRVQRPNAPATTITSHISKDGHYYIHYDPSQCRSLTVREAARLQTFPDNYKFEGNRTAQYHQVGNAVPPLLSHMIAGIVFEILERMD